MRKLLAYLLCISQVLSPLPLLAMEVDSAVLTMQNAQKRKIVEAASSSNAPREVDCFTLNKSTAGDFRLSLDPSLLRENLTLHLIYENTAVGQVTYTTGQLTLQAWGGHAFSLGASAGFECRALAVQTDGSLTLRDKLKADVAYFEAKEGSTEKGAEVRTKVDLILKGFQNFDHRGTFLAKRNLNLLEMGTYTTYEGSESLALCLYTAHAKKLTDGGTTAASIALLSAENAIFGNTYKFMGDRLLVNGKDLIETKNGAHMQGNLAVGLSSANRLHHDGIADSVPNGPGVPLARFLDEPLPSPITPMAYKMLMAPLLKLKTEGTAAYQNAGLSGIYLSGANSVTGHGHMKTPSGDVALSGANVQFRGESQSGFFKGNETVVNALDAVLAGMMKARKFQATIGHSLEIPGTIQANSIKIYFPEAPKPVVAAPTPAAAAPAAVAPKPAPASSVPAVAIKPTPTPASAVVSKPTPVVPPPVTTPAPVAVTPKSAPVSTPPPTVVPKPAPAVAAPAPVVTAPVVPASTPATSLVVTKTGTLQGEVTILNPTTVVIEGKIDGKVAGKPVPITISGGDKISIPGAATGSNLVLQSAQKVKIPETGVVKAIPVEPAAKPAVTATPAVASPTPTPAAQAPAIVATQPQAPKKEEPKPTGNVTIISKKVVVDGKTSGVVETIKAEILKTGEKSEIEATKLVDLQADHQTLAGNLLTPVVVTTGKTLETKATSTIVATEKVVVKHEESAKLGGAIQAPTATVVIDAPNIQQSGPVQAKNELIKAQNLTQTSSASNKTGANLQIEAQQSVLAGKNTADVAVVDSPVCHILPGATVAGTQHTKITSMMDFDNKGVVGSKPGSVDLKVGENNHVGEVLGNLTLDTPTHYDVNAIMAGHHPELTSSTESFRLITPHSVLVDHSAHMAKPFGVQAPTIRVTKPLTSSSDWSFETTQGDLLLEAAVNGHGVKLWSVAGLKTRDVRFSSWADLYATSDYHNRGQVEGAGGSWLKVSAANVHNATTRSILRADQTFVEARNGSVHNWNLIQGRVFADVSAKGDVVNHATKTYAPKGKHHGPIPQFHQANITGGTGIAYTSQDGSERKLGLRVVAGNNIINEAGGLSSGSDRYLEANGSGPAAIQHNAVGEKYVKYHKSKRHGAFGHKKKTVTEIDTATATPLSVVAGLGISNTPNSGVRYMGCREFGTHGEDVYGKGNIEFYSLITDHQRIVKKSSGFGLKKSKLDIKEQGAAQTVFVNNGPINHTSFDGRIYGRGVQFQAPSYTPRAKKGILFEDDVLEYSVHRKTSALMPTFFGSSALSGQPLGKALLTSDPFTANLYGLAHATGSGDRLMAGLSGAMDLWNTGSKVAETLNTGGDPTNMLLSRIGNVGIGYTRTSLRINGTRSVPTLFDVGTFTPISEKGIDLLGGTQVRVSVLFNPKAPYLKLSKGKEEVHTRFKSMGFEVGYNIATDTPYASVSGSKSRSDAISYRNALIQIGDEGSADLSGIRRLELDGGNIVTPTISGHLLDVIVTSYQDRLDAKSSSFSVGGSGFGGSSPTGSGSFSKSSTHNRTTNQHSGITATKGFGKDFSIDHLTVSDTELDAVLAATAKKVDFIPIYDSNKSTSIGITLSNLDLSSPGNFGDSLGRSALVMGAGFAAAEVARELGAGDFGASLAGTLGSAFMGHQLNGAHLFGEEAKNTNSTEGLGSQGLSSLGSVSYSRNGKKTSFLALDINAPQLEREWQGIQDFFSSPDAEGPAFEPAPHPYDEVEEQARELLAARLTEEAMRDEPVVQLWDESALTEEPKPAQSKERDSSRDEHEDRADKPTSKKSGSKSKAEKKTPDRKISSADSDSRKSRQGDKASSSTQADEPTYGDLHEPLSAMREFYQSIFGVSPSSTEPTVERRCPELVRSHNEMLALEGSDAPLSRRILATMEFLGSGASCAVRSAFGTDFGQRVTQRTGEYFNIPRADAQTLLSLTYVFMEIARQPNRLWNVSLGGRMSLGLWGQGATGANGAMYKNYVTRTSGLNPRRPANHNYIPFVDAPNAGIWPTANVSKVMFLQEHPFETFTHSFMNLWKHHPGNVPFLVAGHGNEASMEVSRFLPGMSQLSKQLVARDGAASLDHRELSRMILRSEYYRRGDPVVLFSCQTGRQDYGFAQHLANKLGAPVHAPTESIWSSDWGMIRIFEPEHRVGSVLIEPERQGILRTFYPGNSRRGHPTGPSGSQIVKSGDRDPILPGRFFIENDPTTNSHFSPFGHGGGIPRGPSGSNSRTFSELCRDYIRDIEINSGVNTNRQQRLTLKNYLHENMETMEFAPDDLRKAHRNVLFENPELKTKLILRWQREKGQKWPKYKENVYDTDGKIVGYKGAWVTPHHIIHSSHMGPNEWWNIHPVTYFDHKQIHLKGKPGEILHGK